MAIISIQRDQNNTISIVRMQVSDTLATVASTDYILNNQPAMNALNGGVWQWFITDMILVAAEDGNAFFEFVNTDFETVVIFGQVGTGTVNPGLINNLPFYGANGNTLSPLSNLANAILATNSGAVPGLTQVLPTAVQANITRVGTIGIGIWQGTPPDVTFGGTGAASFTAYSVICGGTTSTAPLQNVSGLGTTGFVLTSNGAGALPTWQVSAGSGTVSAGTANDLAFYQSTGTTVSPLSSAASGVLITSGLGVPSISQTLPSAVQGNITALGTIASGVWQGTNIALNKGGTNANLTASNGGIVYSTASALAILAGTATANLPLLSGASGAPSWGGFALSLGGALTTAGALTTVGAFGATFTFTNTTGVTFPTTGTLATTAGSLSVINGNAGTATVSAGAVTINGGTTGLTTTGSGSTLSLTGTLGVPNGGSGLATTTAYGLLTGGTTATGNFQNAGTGATGTVLQGNGASALPTFSTATYPSTTTINQLLFSISNNVIGGVTAGNYGVLISSSAGVPSWLTNGTTGQVLTSTTSGIASWAALALPSLATP